MKPVQPGSDQAGIFASATLRRQQKIAKTLQYRDVRGRLQPGYHKKEPKAEVP